MSNEPKGQLASRTDEAGNEVPDVLRHGGAFDIAAGLNFDGDIFRDVLGPMLKRIEGDDPDRIIELARYQVRDDGFEISPLDFRFAINGISRKRSMTR